MEIDSHAPLIARNEILISAPVEKVWSELTNINKWSDWQPSVSFSELDGELTVGGVFHWKANGLKISSVIKLLEPMRAIGWTGESLGMKAVHIWTLNERDEGTQVTTEESLSGWFARSLKLFDPRFLEKSLFNSLRVLKAHVEGDINRLP